MRPLLVVRERADVRRLVRTLTAQGRMARWILTGLPVFVAGFLFLFHADVMKQFFASGTGQVLLVLSAAMVTAGASCSSRATSKVLGSVARRSAA